MANPHNEVNPERDTPGSAGRTTRTTTTTTSGGNISEEIDRVNDDDNSYFNLPSELKELRQWMAFKFGKPNKHGKRPKVPKNPATGDNAAVDNPQTWGTFQEAVAAVTQFGLDGIGFTFTENDPYAGIDLDGGCRDPTTGELTPWAGELVKWIDSYTEASVSGTGLHILAKAQLRSGGGKRGNLEMYDCGRYFVMTGEHLGGTPPTIEERQGVIDTLYAENFSRKLNGKAKQDKPKKASAKQVATLQEIASALKVLPAVEHEDWLRVGMAIHSLDSGKAGFALWVEWSKSCPEKFDLDDCHTRWRSFTPEGGVTAATIFGLARDHGWKNTADTHARTEAASGAGTGDEEAGIAALVAAEADGTTGAFHLTDLGNAERFVAEHGRDFLYCTPWKKWLAWDGTRWERDDRQAVRQRVRTTVRGMYSQAVNMVKQVENLESDTAKKQLAKKQMQLLAHAIKSENAKRVGAMIDLAQMDLTVMPEEFDTNLWALNVANGTIDLRTGTMRPHTRTDLITKCVPIVYDPNATCPQWEQFLSEIMGGNDGGNGDLVDFLWKAIGYSLTGDVREDCLFLLYGLGANGKSTFLKILRALLAEYSKQAAFSTFLVKDKAAIPNDLAALQGARLVVASETEEGKRMSMSVVKALTGREAVPARFLFSEFFEYPPQMKVWLGANHKPVITGTDHATWRRIRLIPFTQKFEGATDDKELGDKLLAELPGILAWAVRGGLAWQAEGLPMPEAVKVATADYKAESDVIGAFLGECCVIEERANVLIASLYDSYVAWCQKSGEDARTKRNFGDLLKERGFERDRGTGGIRIWKGIKLASTE